MRSLGYLNYVNNNENASKTLKLLLCLPLLPVLNMQTGFTLIQAFAINRSLGKVARLLWKVPI